MKQTTKAILAAALTLAGNSVLARAESYCVACYGPDAVYRCVVAGAPESAPPDPRNQVQCIKQLAKQGSHARCSVERFSTNGCDGPERTISTTAAAVPMVPANEVRSQAAASSASPHPDEELQNSSGSEPAAAERANTGNEPPRTVEELAKSTVETTKKSIDDVTGNVKSSTEKAGEQIESAGSTIKHAAQKSWNCLSSLFTDC